MINSKLDQEVQFLRSMNRTESKLIKRVETQFQHMQVQMVLNQLLDDVVEVSRLMREDDQEALQAESQHQEAIKDQQEGIQEQQQNQQAIQEQSQLVVEVEVTSTTSDKFTQTLLQSISFGCQTELRQLQDQSDSTPKNSERSSLTLPLQNKETQTTDTPQQSFIQTPQPSANQQERSKETQTMMNEAQQTLNSKDVTDSENLPNADQPTHQDEPKFQKLDHPHLIFKGDYHIVDLPLQAQYMQGTISEIEQFIRSFKVEWYNLFREHSTHFHFKPELTFEQFKTFLKYNPPLKENVNLNTYNQYVTRSLAEISQFNGRLIRLIIVHHVAKLGVYDRYLSAQKRVQEQLLQS